MQCSASLNECRTLICLLNDLCTATRWSADISVNLWMFAIEHINYQLQLHLLFHLLLAILLLSSFDMQNKPHVQCFTFA